MRALRTFALAWLLGCLVSGVSAQVADVPGESDTIAQRATWSNGLQVDFYTDATGSVLADPAKKGAQPKFSFVKGKVRYTPICEKLCDDDKPPFCLLKNCTPPSVDNMLNVPSVLLEAGFGVEFGGSPAEGNQSVRLITNPGELEKLELRAGAIQ